MRFSKVSLAIIVLTSLLLNSVLSLEKKGQVRVDKFFEDKDDKSCYGSPCCPSIVKGHHKATKEYPGGELGKCLCHCHEYEPLPYEHDRNGINKDHVFCQYGQGYTKAPRTMTPMKKGKKYKMGLEAVMHGGSRGRYISRNGSPRLLFAKTLCSTIAVTLIMLF